MSSIKSTLGALLGTVSSTATVATSTLNAASSGAEMLNKYVEKHAKQQRKDYAVEELTMDAVAEEKASIHAVERARTIRAMNLTAEELVLFNDTQLRVRAALANTK